jgi:beta-glucosidase
MIDRECIDLPGTQNQLISAVAAANPNTVVALNTGSHRPFTDARR